MVEFCSNLGKKIEHWLNDFCEGKHRFSPMRQYKFTDGKTARSWAYLDRLVMHLIFKTLRPTFKHVISPLCKHLSGPSVIKKITNQIKEALTTQRFNYIMRIDIKSFYASINHKILLSQIQKHFNDPIILKYLEDIITIAVDDGGNVFLPTKGIPRDSSLSPLFGAIYLSDLDQAFTKKNGIYFCRYMDDILVLAANKYTKAKKILFEILRSLRLNISPHKTKMGKLRNGFHFLGANFVVSQNTQGKIQDVAVKVHPRSCRRARDKVVALRDNAVVHPALIQRYL